jgi:rhamnose utilization protein RhaD (predicted bifunctional aldolase and dehydrogenase)
MATSWRPELVDDDLVQLSRSLGEPAKDLVILAEGNVSKRLDAGSIVIKTSGSYMSRSVPEEFVVTEIAPVMDMIDSSTATQKELSAVLDGGEHDGARRAASIETLVHAVVHSLAPATFVGHTHPTPIVGLLASIHAPRAFDEWVYSDEAVVIGRPLYVPYAEPGLALGRAFATALRAALAQNPEPPSLILLGNHGIVARGNSAESIEAITLMAVKGARVRLHALAAGGVVGLGRDTVDHYFDREDMSERRRRLSGS